MTAFNKIFQNTALGANIVYIFYRGNVTIFFKIVLWKKSTGILSKFCCG